MWWMWVFFFSTHRDAFHSLSRNGVCIIPIIHGYWLHGVRVCVCVHCAIFHNVSLLNPRGVNVCNGFQITVRLSFASSTRFLFFSFLLHLYRWHLFGSSCQRMNRMNKIHAQCKSTHITNEQKMHSRHHIHTHISYSCGRMCTIKTHANKHHNGICTERTNEWAK